MKLNEIMQDKNTEVNSDISAYLYHGTALENWKKIQKEGLTCEGGRLIYLTNAPEVAEAYIHGNGVILKVATHYLNQKYFGPDDYELKDFLEKPWAKTPDLSAYSKWNDVPWKLSLSAVHQITYAKNIPPEALSVYNYIGIKQ